MDTSDEIVATYITEEYSSFHYILFYSPKHNLSFYCDDIIVGLNNARERTFMVERGEDLFMEWRSWLEENLTWLRPNMVKFLLTKKHVKNLGRFLQESAVSETRAVNQIVGEGDGPARRLAAIDNQIYNLYRASRK